MRATIIGLLMLLLIPVTAFGANFTGNDMLECCQYNFKEPTTLSQDQRLCSITCAYYVMAYVDAIKLYNLINEGRGLPLLVCLPEDDLSLLQYIRLVVNWLEEHPKVLHRNANVFVATALIKVYPCEQ